MSKLQLWAQYRIQPAEIAHGKDDWTLVAEYEETEISDLFLRKLELQKSGQVADVFTTKQINIEVQVL